MRQIFRLAAMFFVLVAIGCASRRAVDAGSEPSGFSRQEVPGTWSLSDDENCTFDVRLSEQGGAVSNWSKGPTGAQGEVGHWTLEHHQLVIDYTDGWRDVIHHSKTGKFSKVSFAPGAPRDGAPTNSGLAVRTGTDLAKWVGVYEVPQAVGGVTHPGFVSIQSTHAAWRSVAGVTVGSWWAAGDTLCVRWADGSIDEFAESVGSLEARTWAAGTAIDARGHPVGSPAGKAAARRVG